VIIPPTVSATVAYDSSSNPITLPFGADTATSVAVLTAPTNGMVTASDTSFIYTPRTGFAGTDSFVYNATNATGGSPTATVTITVSAPTISVTPTTLTAGRAGVAYSKSLSVSGGQSPYSFSTVLASGALSGGLSLSSTGAVSGTPTAVGSFAFTVTGTDSSTATAIPFTSSTITLVIAAPVVALGPTSLPGAISGTAYSQTVTASGGTAPYTYSVSAGALPAGLSLNAATGVVSGTPGAVNSYSFTVTAADSTTGTGAPYFAAQAYSILTSLALPTAGPTMATVAYDSSANPIALSLGGGPVASVAVSAAASHGTATASGISIVYTPTTGYHGTDSFAYIAANISGTSSPAMATITVSAPTISVTPTTLTAGTAGTAYGQSLTASGGQSPYSFSTTLASGALPGGLSLSSTGAITGRPSAVGSFSFTAAGTDSSTATAVAFTSSTVTLVIVAPAIALGPTSLPGGNSGTAYSQTVTASGGMAPYTYSVSAGALPTGLSLNAATGVVSGTPSAVNSYSFTVKAADSTMGAAAPYFGTRVYSISIAPALPTAGPVTATVAFDSTNTAIALNLGGGAAVSVAVASAALHGMATATSMSIAYTPASGYSGSDSFTYTATNTTGTSSAATVTIRVGTASTTTGGQAYAYQGTIDRDTLGTSGVANPVDSPVAAVVDSVHGHLFIADAAGQRVQILDTASLSVIATLGVSGIAGSDGAHFNQPGGVGFDAATDRIFVADTGNQRIQIFDAASFAYRSTLGITGVAGTDNAHFNAPTSAAINPVAHQLYIAELGNDRVQIFDAGTLAYIATLGTTAAAGNDNFHFNQPRDAELNASTNQIMVADSANGRVQIFDATSFAYVATLGGPHLDPAANDYFGSPVTSGFDPTTNLVLIADAGTDDRVQVLDAMTYGYVLTLGTTGSSGTGNGQFAGPAGVAVDPAHARIFVGDPQNDRVQMFSIEPPVIFASVLPGSRSVLLGSPATIFASMINAGTGPLENCRVALPVSSPAGLTLGYQTTNQATNALTGMPDTPTPIAGNNGVQSFVISFHGTAAFSAPGMPIDFDCDGVAPAAIDIGVDTVDLVMSDTPVADIIVFSATSSSNGIVEIPKGDPAAFALASINIGVATPIIVSVDTGTATLPVTATICQSNPGTGQCLAAPAGTVPLSFTAGATPTFSVFPQASGAIPLAPATSRVFVRFKDGDGGLRGSSSVAIEAD
jgi:hypothetical protein